MNASEVKLLSDLLEALEDDAVEMGFTRDDWRTFARDTYVRW